MNAILKPRIAALTSAGRVRRCRITPASEQNVYGTSVLSVDSRIHEREDLDQPPTSS
jgi:hypothetical protein